MEGDEIFEKKKVENHRKTKNLIFLSKSLIKLLIYDQNR